MNKSTLIAIGVLGCALIAHVGYAADHIDGPRAAADPSADITDAFVWMSPDAQRINLVMDVVRNASASAKFSDSVEYVFHTESRPSYGAPAAPEVDVICVFDPDQTVQCFAGDKAVVGGDASDPAGIASADGKLRVFTGLRNDPFFFNLAGFRATGRLVTAAAPSLSFDPAGCPLLDTTTASTLVTQLKSAPGGGPAVNAFANFNVLAIVVSVDKSILTKGGPIVGVAASTNRQ